MIRIYIIDNKWYKIWMNKIKMDRIDYMYENIWGE